MGMMVLHRSKGFAGYYLFVGFNLPHRKVE
jgi:hypothetical protein